MVSDMNGFLSHTILRSLLPWLILGFAIGQAHAQTDFDPTSPPEPGSLTLQLSASPSGSASFTINGSSATTATFTVGETVTVIATPISDYEFVAWLDEDGESVSDSEEYSFEIEGNTYLTAQMRFNPSTNPDEPGEHYYYTLVTTADPTDGGWVKQSGSGTYEAGDEVTLTAYAYTDYELAYWEIDGESVGTEETYTFTIEENTYVTAVFTWDPTNPDEPGGGCSLYLTVSDTNAGYVTQSGTGTYSLGDTVKVTASPYTGYEFVGWYSGSTCLSTSVSYTLIISQQSTTLEARFQSGTTQTLTIEVDTVNFADGGTYTLTGLAIVGQTITVVAVPDDGYAFDGWYLDGVFIEEAEMSYTFLVESAGTLTVAFQELPISLEVEGGESDWARVTRYHADSIVCVADSVVGYTFNGWYYGSTLLESDYRYVLKVSLLKAAVLANIKAVYTNNTTSNEQPIAVEADIRTLFDDGRLSIETGVALRRIMVFGFDGKVLAEHGKLPAGDRLDLNLPKRGIIIRMETADGETVVRKLMG